MSQKEKRLKIAINITQMECIVVTRNKYWYITFIEMRIGATRRRETSWQQAPTMISKQFPTRERNREKKVLKNTRRTN
jgi:hypothetical protein